MFDKKVSNVFMVWMVYDQAKHGVWKLQIKVSFNIASEASYVYILSSQKSIKNAKNGPFWRVFEKLKEQKNGWKIQMRHFEKFSNIVVEILGDKSEIPRHFFCRKIMPYGLKIYYTIIMLKDSNFFPILTFC